MWSATVFTLYPELFPGPLDASILGRARAQNLWSLETIDIRGFSDNAYGSVDDTPAGGGAGLVMRADILAAAIDSVNRNDRPLLCLSPRGRRFEQSDAERISKGNGVMLLCGRFEGIDERIFAARDIEEVSLGDFILAGGEIPSMAIIEACVRLIPDVLGNASSLGEESFSSGASGRILEYPQYTRPREFEGLAIPEALLSGDHKRIAEWRHREALRITRARRPDLLDAPQKASEEYAETVSTPKGV